MVNIKELRMKRIELGITQKEVGKYLCRDQTTVKDYELGRQPICERLLDKYARYIHGCLNGEIPYNQSSYVVRHYTGKSSRTKDGYRRTREGYLLLGTFD